MVKQAVKETLTDGKNPGTFFSRAMTWSLVVSAIGGPRLTEGEVGGGRFDVNADEEPSC